MKVEDVDPYALVESSIQNKQEYNRCIDSIIKRISRASRRSGSVPSTYIWYLFSLPELNRFYKEVNGVSRKAKQDGDEVNFLRPMHDLALRGGLGFKKDSAVYMVMGGYLDRCMALLNQKKGVEYALRDKGYIQSKGVGRNGVELWAVSARSAG